MDFPLKLIDTVGTCRDAEGKRCQVNLKLGGTEWELLEKAAQEYGFTRNGMARRLLCLGLRSLEKA